MQSNLGRIATAKIYPPGQKTRRGRQVEVLFSVITTIHNDVLHTHVGSKRFHILHPEVSCILRAQISLICPLWSVFVSRESFMSRDSLKYDRTHSLNPKTASAPLQWPAFIAFWMSLRDPLSWTWGMNVWLPAFASPDLISLLTFFEDAQTHARQTTYNTTRL